NGVPERFAHFLAAPQQHAVDKDHLWRLDSGAQEERRPVDGMESQDVLAHHVKRRPVAVKVVVTIITPAERADVIDQGIKPDVNRMPRIIRNRYSPLHRHTADRQIFEPAGYK